MLENTAERSSDIENNSYCKDEYFVAQVYNVSVGTVRRWRYEGRGPRFRKLGSLVRYSLEDIYNWLASRPTGGERGGCR